MLMNNIENDIIEVNQYISNHKKEFNKEIGLNLKLIRLNKGITLEKMGELTMMAPTYIAQIENGVNGISLNKFIVFCNALKINAQEILNEFIYTKDINEDILYEEIQGSKSISKNIIKYIKRKK